MPPKTERSTPIEGNDKYKFILEQWNELSEKEQSELLKMLQQDKIEKEEKEEKEEQKNLKLKLDTDKILKDLKENHVKKEDAEVKGYKGKKVHINLPAVGNFEGFKFDYFVSNGYVLKEHFEAQSELKKKSYSMSDVSKLLQAMNEYMTELGGENDGNINYETDLKCWEDKSIRRCKAGDCLKAITGLDWWYWLSDNDVAGQKGSRATWYFSNDNCYFENDHLLAYLFLRLTD